MTPIEKAKEIVDKYLNVEIMFYDADTVGEYIDIMRTEEAKQCALIAVEEIMDYRLQELDELIRTQNLKADLGGVIKQSKLINYWKEVKHEIEKL